MTYPPFRFTRTLAARGLIAVLAVIFLCSGLSSRHGPVAGSPAPVWQAGDDDKGGMGTG